MSSRKRTVDAYFDGFRASDHDAILALLTDEVVWVIHGHGRTKGKAAFDREIENDAFEGSPKLTVERLIEEGDTHRHRRLKRPRTANEPRYRSSARGRSLATPPLTPGRQAIRHGSRCEAGSGSPSVADEMLRVVPTISRFYGIVIRMYFAESRAAALPCIYAGDEAVIEIATGEILRGSLPDRALRMVREWTSMHRGERAANWERLQVPEQPAPIAPLP